MKLAVLILAAGESQRFKSPKLLYKVKGLTLFEHTYLKYAKNFNVFVVIGAYNLSFYFDFPCIYLNNKNFKKGMFSSLKTGLEYLANFSYDGVIFTPADVPFYSKSTIKKLVLEFKKNFEKFIIPVYNGKSGHPVIIPEKFFKKLKALPSDFEGGLGRFIKELPERCKKKVAVKDKFILIDIDYKSDLKWLKK